MKRRGIKCNKQKHTFEAYKSKTAVSKLDLGDYSAQMTGSMMITVSAQEMIDSEMLFYLYEMKQVLKIIGKDYVIEIDGKVHAKVMWYFAPALAWTKRR